MRKASFLALHFICVLSFQAKTVDSSQDISDDSSRFVTENSFDQPPTYNFANFTKQGRLTPVVNTAPLSNQEVEDSFEAPPTFVLAGFKQGRLTPVAQAASIQVSAEKISPAKAATAAMPAGSEIASSTAISPLSPASSPGPDETIASRHSAFVTPKKQNRSAPLPSNGTAEELTNSFSSTVLNLSEIKLSPFNGSPQSEHQLDSTKKASPSANNQSVSFISSPGKTLTPDRSSARDQSSIFAELSASMMTDRPEKADSPVAFPHDQSSIQTLFSEGSLEEFESDEEPGEEASLPSPHTSQELTDAETEASRSPDTLPSSPPQIALTPLNSPSKEKVADAPLAPAPTGEDDPRETIVACAISIEKIQDDGPVVDISVAAPATPKNCSVVEKYIEAQEEPSLNISIHAPQAAPAPAIEKEQIADFRTPVPARPSPQAGNAPTIATGTGAAGLFALALYKHLLIKALERKAVLSDNEIQHLRALKRWRFGAGTGSACMIALAAYLYKAR